jgi:hypothetical protein
VQRRFRPLRIDNRGHRGDEARGYRGAADARRARVSAPPRRDRPRT